MIAWNDLLPTSVEVGGAEYEIRSDYRDVLNVCAALSDPDLDGQEKALALLDSFYPGLDSMPPEHFQEAIQRCFWFINGGEEDRGKKSPKLVDWEQDFKYIVSPVNRVAGTEIRSLEYVHWWTFLGYFREIGDCLFAQIVRIRDRKARGKSLDKSDREWYRKNRDLVDFKTHYTEAEEELFREWGGK